MKALASGAKASGSRGLARAPLRPRAHPDPEKKLGSSHHASAGNLATLRALGIRAKLDVSEPSDPEEQEADRIADAFAGGAAVSPQIAQGGGGSDVHRACATCEQDEAIHRKPLSGNGASPAPAVLPGLGSSGGQRLPLELRRDYERFFDADLSSVRIHAGAQAAESSREIHAQAFTVGRDIYFGSGQFRPESGGGRRLLAHELAHVVQQANRQALPARAMRQETQTIVVDNLGCPRESCAGKEDGIKADLQRALSYTSRALSALAGSPSAETERLLDWYFNDHSDGTVRTVRERLACIQAALQETADNDHYGCGQRKGAHAHTGGSDTMCQDSGAPVCLNPSYFDELSSRERAEALVHECGHRIGLSSGTPDIQSSEGRFQRLDTAEALVNTDSYAMFVGAVAQGARATWKPYAGVGGGITSLGGWYAKLDLGIERQHPSWRDINPIGGLSLGVRDTEFVGSLFLGARLADARPGTKGAVYLNLRGEVSLVGGEASLGYGGEAKLGYRIGSFDIALAGGALHEPSRKEGARTVYSGGLSFTFIPENL